MLRLQVSGPMQVGWFILEGSDSESGDLVARHRRLPLTIELGLRGNWHLVKNYSTLEACVCRWAQGSESRTRARKVFCVFHVLPQVLGGPLSKSCALGVSGRSYCCPAQDRSEEPAEKISLKAICSKENRKQQHCNLS